MTQRYEPIVWQNRIVDTDGTVVQAGTPLSAENLNRIEQMVAFLANALGMADGIATLNDSGVVPSEQLPSNLREIRVVADIAARDELEPFEGLRVFVVDATADESVTNGWAEYVYNGEQFVKVGEGESLDVTLSWDVITNKPTTFIPSAHTHTESQITDLDKYTKREVDDKLAEKAPNQLASSTDNGLMSATDYSNLTTALQQLTTVMAHVENTANPHSVTKSQVGLSSVLNYGIATQANAEAGTSNALYMTPLRVKNAIDKFVPTALSGFTNDKNFVSSNATQITVSTTAPTSPSVNDIWIKT